MEKTTRFELGSKYVEICLNEYEHTLKYLGSAEPPEEGPEKKTVSIETDLKVKVGNTTKDKVDAREELIAKTGLSSTKIGQIVTEVQRGTRWAATGYSWARLLWVRSC